MFYNVECGGGIIIRDGLAYVSVDLLFPRIVLLYHLIAIDGKLLSQVGMIHDAETCISQGSSFVLDDSVLFMPEFWNSLGDKACHYYGNATAHGYKNLVLNTCSNTNGSYG